ASAVKSAVVVAPCGTSITRSSAAGCACAPRTTTTSTIPASEVGSMGAAQPTACALLRSCPRAQHQLHGAQHVAARLLGPAGEQVTEVLDLQPDVLVDPEHQRGELDREAVVRDRRQGLPAR